MWVSLDYILRFLILVHKFIAPSFRPWHRNIILTLLCWLAVSRVVNLYLFKSFFFLFYLRDYLLELIFNYLLVLAFPFYALFWLSFFDLLLRSFLFVFLLHTPETFRFLELGSKEAKLSFPSEHRNYKAVPRFNFVPQDVNWESRHCVL